MKVTLPLWCLVKMWHSSVLPLFHSCGPTFLPVTGFIASTLWLLSAPLA